MRNQHCIMALCMNFAVLSQVSAVQALGLGVADEIKQNYNGVYKERDCHPRSSARAKDLLSYPAGMALRRKPMEDSGEFLESSERKSANTPLLICEELHKPIGEASGRTGVKIAGPAMPERSPAYVEKLTIKDPKSLTVKDYTVLLQSSKELFLDWAHSQNLEITACESPMISSEDAVLIHGLSGYFPAFKDTGNTMAIFKDGRVIYLYWAVSGGIPKGDTLPGLIAHVVKDFEAIYGPSTAHDYSHGQENFHFNTGDIVLHLGISPCETAPNSAYLTLSIELKSRLESRLQRIQSEGTVPENWTPQFQYYNKQIPVPFGESLLDFSKFLQQSRIEVINGRQDADMRSWIAPNMVMLIPGWGVARGVSFHFTNDSGDWELTGATVVQVLQSSPFWLKKRFETTLAILSRHFGEPKIQNGKAIWSRSGFCMTLSILSDDNNIGYKREGGLLLAFTKK